MICDSLIPDCTESLQGIRVYAEVSATVFFMIGLNCQAKERPNIIYLMLDEWGYYEMSGLGHEKISTPTFDQVMKEGMRFTQCLAGGPVCGPTRAVLMTGKHLGHATMRSNGGAAPIRADDVTIAEQLKKAGYATGGFGKWGIGGRGTSGVPEKQGFDIFYGYYDQVHAHTYYPPYLIRNSKEVRLPGNGDSFYEGKHYAQDLIFAEAMEFIKSNADQPFFCYLPWTPPHGLWGIPEDDPAWLEFKDKDASWDYGQQTKRDARVYAAMLKMCDRQLGDILKLLKTLDIDENTILFLCGDNGGQPYFQRPDGFFGPNVDPKTGKRVFRGGKGQLYEGGLRIPFMVRWPGKIKGGTTTDHLCYFPDIMPTVAELAGLPRPVDTDGITMLPTLLGRGQQQQHEGLYWEAGNWQSVRDATWRWHRKNGKDIELYDLTNDMLETKNVAAQNPSIVKKFTEFSEAAHLPLRPGEIYDRKLMDKDHTQTKPKMLKRLGQ